jgi:hypothetical protein
MIDRTSALALAIVLAAAAPGAAQPAPDGAAARAALPFAPGENLVFDVRSARFGRIGEAHMRVAGPDTVRGRAAYVLSFDFSAKVLLFKVSDRTRSWFDPATASSLRYTKRERSPLSDRDEQVEIFPAERVWVQDGTAADMPTATPLDELSFLYYVRTLPLADHDVYLLERHFDARRNPVAVTVIGRERRRQGEGTPIDGSYDVVVVDMTVPDVRQNEGTSRIRLYLTDDALRVPVRLETTMPYGGTMVLELTARRAANP